MNKEKDARQAKRFFLMFALPCERNPTKRNELEERLIDEDYSPSEEELTEIAPRGVARYKKFAGDGWNTSDVMRYWTIRHNNIVQQGGDEFGEIPLEYGWFCEVHLINYAPQTELKIPSYLKNKLNPDDGVLIHRGQVIMKQ